MHTLFSPTKIKEYDEEDLAFLQKKKEEQKALEALKQKGIVHGYPQVLRVLELRR